MKCRMRLSQIVLVVQFEVSVDDALKLIFYTDILKTNSIDFATVESFLTAAHCSVLSIGDLY